jgi:fumarylacetoacetase
LDHHVFCEPTLNKFIELGPEYRREARETIQALFAKDAPLSQKVVSEAVFDAHTAQMLMPVFIRDYTDFYSSKNHAFNVGCMFRNPAEALNPNWLHLPVGYHGRASSIVVSGTPIRRPKGQVSADKLTP